MFWLHAPLIAHWSCVHFFVIQTRAICSTHFERVPFNLSFFIVAVLFAVRQHELKWWEKSKWINMRLPVWLFWYSYMRTFRGPLFLLCHRKWFCNCNYWTRIDFKTHKINSCQNEWALLAKLILNKWLFK